jgi:hypothetical protein
MVNLRLVVPFGVNSNSGSCRCPANPPAAEAFHTARSDVAKAQENVAILARFWPAKTHNFISTNWLEIVDTPKGAISICLRLKGSLFLNQIPRRSAK